MLAGDGTKRTQSSVGPDESEQTWPPDGSQIAYLRDNGARGVRRAVDLVVLDATGRNPRRITRGALIVAGDGSVIATGIHTYAGIKHAEVLAIETAQRNGRSLSGATLYINLESCSHHGRTPPCVETIIASGIRRVVTAMRDPNPLVSGRGFQQLRAAGIDVVEDILGDEARKLNEAFAKYIRHRTPFITLKAGMTLDGKIAPPPAGFQNPKPSVAPTSAGTELGNPSARGSSSASGGWITSEAARPNVQQLCHACDAVMVGVGTVSADDPLLTARPGKASRRPLLRVILDSRLRLPLESRVVKTSQSDVVVFCAFAEEKKRKALEQRNVQVVQVALAASVASAPLSAKVQRMPIRRRTATGKPIRPPLAPGMEGRPDLRACLLAGAVTLVTLTVITEFMSRTPAKEAMTLAARRISAMSTARMTVMKPPTYGMISSTPPTTPRVTA